MQNKKNLTQFSQQHQNIVQVVDQILQEKKSTIPPPEQILSIENNYFPPSINASNTGIKEFDKLLDGGFTKGSIILLAGSSGSGKTIFSFQWLFEGIKNNENGIYITLTEPLFKTLENLEKLNYYNKEAIENEKLRIIDLREIYGKEGFNQQKILDFIEDEVKRTNAKRLCIDSITAIAYQLDDRAKIRAFIFAVGTTLATLGCTTVLISEVSEMNKYSKYEVEEFISDAIIRFDQITVKDEPQRIMRIIKVRGRNYRSDDIFFKITKDGISVFPKLRVPLDHFSTTERISMGISALDDMLGGGIFVGSSTFVTGSPGTGKSTLGLSFLAEGLKNGETCLYAGFEESKTQVLRNAKNFGWNFEKYEKEGLLVMRCIYPNEKHLEEHLADIRQIVEGKKIKRCVVDPLSAISSAFSPDAFISFSKRLNGYLKTQEVTPLFTSASTSLIENTKDVDAHLSTLSDNIILLRYVEMQGDVQCVINIIKMRGSEHSKSLRMYNITDKGLVVGKSLEGYEGVTTGVSKKIAELEEERKELKEVIKQKELAEKVLRESESRYRSLFENMLDGFAYCQIVYDDQNCPVDFIYRGVNSAFEELTGLKNVIGKRVTEAIPGIKESNPELMEIYGRVALTGTPERFEVKIESLGLLLSISVYSPKKGYFVTIFDNITERKKLEEKLKIFSNAVNDAYDAFVLTDMVGNVEFTNESTLKIFGYSSEEVMKFNVSQFAANPEDAGKILEGMKNKGEWSGEVFGIRKNKEKFPTLLSISLIKNDKGNPTGMLGVFRDVTERKKAEEELKESEEKFRLLFNDSPLGIALVDSAGIIKEVNNSLLQLLSIRKEEFIGKNFVQLISVYGLDVQEQTSDFKNRIAGKPSKSEITFLSNENKKVTITIQSSVIKSNDVIIGVLFILEDITERKRIEGMLSETNQYLENLFNYANAPIIVWDAQFAITRFNHAFESLTGRTVIDVIGKSLELLFPPDQMESSMELIRKTQSGKQWDVVEIDVLHLDGSIKTVLWNSANLFTPDGKTLIATIAQGQDITKRKKAQEELKESEEKFRDLFENANDLIQSADANGRFIYVNKKWLQTLGYTENEVKSLTITDILRKDQISKCMEIIDEVRNGKSFEKVETVFVSKDGHEIYVEGGANAKFKDGKFIATRGFFRDITERKRAQEELKVANEKLNQIKSDFFEVTTREIRSPLTTIKGYMEMLSNRTFGEINDEQKKYLDIMLRNTNQLDELVSDLVDISSIESGDMIFTLKKTNISKMMNEAVAKIESSANIKNIAVNVEIEDQIPDLIVDKDRIKQVIINILSYTIKFSPDKTTVNLRAKKQETNVLFEIQDPGIDISKDKQKKIFKAFYRAEEGKSKEYSGGGIRLGLSRGIVTIHGGKMWLESQAGKGITFKFTLPIKPVDNIQTRCKESGIFESKKDDENR